MKDAQETRLDRVARRRAREDFNLFGRLSAAAAASRAEAQKLLKTTCDLSVVEWRILWDLHEAGPLTVRDMASIQRADHSLISRALPTLLAKNLVTMTRDDTDKRQTMVALSDAGAAAYAQAAPVMKARRDRLRASYPPDDLEKFVALLDQFEVFLEQEADQRQAEKEHNA